MIARLLHGVPRHALVLLALMLASWRPRPFSPTTICSPC